MEDSQYGAPRRAADSDAFDEPATSPHSEPRYGAPSPLGQFSTSLLRTLASTVVPGSGLLFTRLGLLGFPVALAFVIVAGWLLITALTNPTSLLAAVVDPGLMRAAMVGLIIVMLVWVAVICGTYLITRPYRISRSQRVIGSATVFVLSLVVAIPMAVAANYAYQSAQMVSGIFGEDGDQRSGTRPTISSKGNPWGNKQRLNILLLGGDTGEGRKDSLGLRTDSIMIASIDIKSGNTVLIQVPRNMARTPFPPGSALAKVYPRGFYDGRDADNSEYLANAIWNNVPRAHPELFKDTDYPGADAVKLGIGAATGLQLDYFVVVNIDGIQQLVDAMGGVTVNINFPISRGSEGGCQTSGFLAKGPNQRLDGHDAMVYARSRCNDPLGDFGRMQRQSCLVNAVIKQANPTKMVTRYEAIAKSATKMVLTDIPQNALAPLVDLSWKVKDAAITRVVFISGQNGFFSPNPDFNLMRQRVSAAIAQNQPQSASPKTASPTTSAPAPTTSNPTSTDGSIRPGSATATRSTSASPARPASSASVAAPENVDDVCGYHPVE